MNTGHINGPLMSAVSEVRFEEQQIFPIMSNKALHSFIHSPSPGKQHFLQQAIHNPRKNPNMFEVLHNTYIMFQKKKKNNIMAYKSKMEDQIVKKKWRTKMRSIIRAMEKYHALYSVVIVKL